MKDDVKVSRLPNPKVCLTQVHPALREYSHCHTPRPQHCPFVLPFGRGFFCRHPEREKFLVPLAIRHKKA